MFLGKIHLAVIPTGEMTWPPRGNNPVTSLPSDMCGNSPMVPVVSRQALSAILGASETRGHVKREAEGEASGQWGFQEAVNGPA